MKALEKEEHRRTTLTIANETNTNNTATEAAKKYLQPETNS